MLKLARELLCVQREVHRFVLAIDDGWDTTRPQEPTGSRRAKILSPVYSSQLFVFHQKLLVVVLPGAAGFEPTHAGTKNRSLTAWLHPYAHNHVKAVPMQRQDTVHKNTGFRYLCPVVAVTNRDKIIRRHHHPGTHRLQETQGHSHRLGGSVPARPDGIHC